MCQTWGRSRWKGDDRVIVAEAGAGGRRFLKITEPDKIFSHRSDKRTSQAMAERSFDQTLDLLHLNSGRALGPLLHAVFDAITFGQGVEAFTLNG